MKTIFFTVLCTAALMAGSTALAAETGRYQIQPTQNGVVRLDTQTGELAYCHEVEGALSCSPIEAEAILEKRINALEARIAELEARLARNELPSDEELERGFSIMEQFMRRFKGFADELEREDPAHSEPLPQKT